MAGQTTDSTPSRLDGTAGQSAVLVLVVVAVLAAASCWAIADVGRTTATRHRAQIAADAAALASSGGDRPAAVRLADANGGTLVSWRFDADTLTVQVVVDVGGITATARATRAP